MKKPADDFPLELLKANGFSEARARAIVEGFKQGEISLTRSEYLTHEQLFKALRKHPLYGSQRTGQRTIRTDNQEG
jgi:hypothetical protein